MVCCVDPPVMSTVATHKTQLERIHLHIFEHGDSLTSQFFCRAITSTVVTIPCLWYLIQPQLHKSEHGGGHGHGEHETHEEGSEEHEEAKGKESDGEHEEGSGEDEGKTEPEGEGGSEDGDSSGSSSEGGQDTPESSDDENPGNTAHEKEGGGNVQGVQFKGSTSGGTKDGEQGDVRKHIPDAKGANKKRIESEYGNQLGEAEKEGQDPKNQDLV